MMFFLYDLVSHVLILAALPLLLGAGLVAVLCRGYPKEFVLHRAGFLGFAPGWADGGTNIWIHAASLGEFQGVKPLLKPLLRTRPDAKIFFSTCSRDAYALARRAPQIHQVFFLPLDLKWIIRRVYSVIRPSLLLVMEIEIWPNLFREAAGRGCPLYIVNGRMPEKELRRYELLGGFFRDILSNVRRFFMQSPAQAERMKKLCGNGNRILVTPSTKYDSDDGFRPASRHHRGHLGLSSDEVLMTFGSIHKEEFAILADAIRLLSRRYPRCRFVAAPRHPNDSKRLAGMMARRGLLCVRWTGFQEGMSFDVLILDTLGDLVTFYSFSDAAFVGGSLTAAGGHNIVEAARFGIPILFGPHMHHAKDAADQILSGQGAVQTGTSPQDIAEKTGLIIGNAALRKTMGENARRVSAQMRGGTLQVMSAIFAQEA